MYRMDFGSSSSSCRDSKFQALAIRTPSAHHDCSTYGFSRGRAVFFRGLDEHIGQLVFAAIVASEAQVDPSNKGLLLVYNHNLLVVSLCMCAVASVYVCNHRTCTHTTSTHIIIYIYIILMAYPQPDSVWRMIGVAQHDDGRVCLL